MIVLDTHAWVWWIGKPEQMSRKAQAACEGAMADRALYVSSISVWEVALLVRKGRLHLTIEVEDWIRRSEALPFLHFVPVDNNIALKSVALAAQLHPDPADRIIVATAQTLGAPLVTRDQRLRRASVVKTIW